MNILYDKDDAEETQRAAALYAVLVADMRDQGYQQYRAGLLAWQGLFDGAAPVHRLNHTIKAALDPAGVLAPGRYGIG